MRPIVAAVREQGAPALYAAAERFDGVAPPSLKVPADVIAGALETLDPAVRAALEESIRRARLVHADQRRTDTTTRPSPTAAPSASAGCRSTGWASTCRAAWPSTPAASS